MNEPPDRAAILAEVHNRILYWNGEDVDDLIAMVVDITLDLVGEE